MMNKKKSRATIFGCISLLHTQKFLHTQRQTDRHKQTYTKSDSGYQTPLLCTRFEFQNQIILSGNRTLSYQAVLSFICYQCFHIFLFLVLLSPPSLLLVVLICCCCCFCFCSFNSPKFRLHSFEIPNST